MKLKNPTKVLYIHQYFKTPNEPGGTRSYWFAKKLIESGIQVLIITSRNHQEKLIERQKIDGIDVIYIRNSYSNSFGFFRRLFSFFRFMFISIWLTIREKNITLLFATSTPLTVGITALITKKLKNTPYIFEVRDLWPEVPIQMGAIKNALLISIAYWIEKKIYSNAIHIIALSPGMQDGIIKKGFKPEKITMIPNMAKNDKFFLRKKNEELEKKLNLNNNSFKVLHFGTLGIANGLQYIINAAKIFNEIGIDDVTFMFAGEGGQEVQLKKEVKELNLRNVLFLGNFKMEMISEIVNLADCTITTFSNIPILTTNSPNKLFDSLSAQKAIIVNSNGWTRELVEKYNCGAYVDPEKPMELVNLLLKWKNHPDLIKEMGLNGRKIAEEMFDKEILATKFVKSLKKYI